MVELRCCELGMHDEAVKVLQWFLHTKDCSSEASPVDIESVKCIIKVGDCALAWSGR